MKWRLKDVPLISTETMEKFVEIGKKEGVSNVKWSGLTKKKEESE